MCVISEPLTHIINQSINTGIFPDKWKEARVLPLHKSGLTDDPYNYRPIFILSVLSKIFERHVHDHIYKHLSEHNLLYEYQSAFRPQHSCEAALLQVIAFMILKKSQQVSHKGQSEGHYYSISLSMICLCMTVV